MTEGTIKEFLYVWYERSARASGAHFDMASMLQKKYYAFGVPVIALTSLVSTATFATLGESEQLEMQIATGVAALLASVMSAIQTFLRYGERAEQHRVSGVRYSALARELEEKHLFWESVNEEYINDFRTRWDALTADAPTVTDKIWKKYEEKAYIMESTSS